MPARREQGIALVAVLWTLVLLSIVAAALVAQARASALIARNGVDNAVARYAADAGIQRAILDLLNSTRDGVSVRTFHSDGRARVWNFAGCSVAIKISDERGKINLNTAPVPLLAATFVAAGAEPDQARSLADAVADFRDDDDFVRPHGAEEPEYRSAGLAWGPKNSPLQTVDDLKQVLGMTPELYDQVATDVTVFSDGMVSAPPANSKVAAILLGQGIQTEGPASSQAIAYSISATANGPGGARFVREAVVEATRNQYTPIQILLWR